MLKSKEITAEMVTLVVITLVALTKDILVISVYAALTMNH